jgi:hypothetical protein
MGIIEALIIGAALYFGLDQIADALDNVAVGIEQAGIKVADALESEIITMAAEEVED